MSNLILVMWAPKNLYFFVAGILFLSEIFRSRKRLFKLALSSGHVRQFKPPTPAHLWITLASPSFVKDCRWCIRDGMKCSKTGRYDKIENKKETVITPDAVQQINARLRRIIQVFARQVAREYHTKACLVAKKDSNLKR